MTRGKISVLNCFFISMFLILNPNWLQFDAYLYIYLWSIMHTLWPGLPLTDGQSYCSQWWKSMLTQKVVIKTVLIPPGLVPWSFPPEHPAPHPSHCVSLIPNVPKNHTPSLLPNLHTCRLYKAFFPGLFTLFKCFNDTIQTVIFQAFTMRPCGFGKTLLCHTIEH